MTGGGNGGGSQAAKASPAAPAAAQQAPAANGPTQANGGQQGQDFFERGLDAGLAKAAPSAQGLTQKTYRSYRRRLDLFSRTMPTKRSWCRHSNCLPGPLSAPRCSLGRDGEPGL